ncbi:MAG: hypothetical protein KatS3mg002_0218 [Candidatus Woesearchaeota archaeon]|nr:MAG: hypothetical protein KatS3mg002_0218 [Candidatus Woesearchaeota archaeon]
MRNFFDEKIEMSITKYIMNKHIIHKFFKEISDMENVQDHRFFISSDPADCKECQAGHIMCRTHKTFNFLKNVEKIFAVFDTATGIYITRYCAFVPGEPGIVFIPPIHPLKKNGNIFSKVFDSPPVDTLERVYKVGEINTEKINDYYIGNAFVTDDNGQSFRVCLLRLGTKFYPAFIPK